MKHEFGWLARLYETRELRLRGSTDADLNGLFDGRSILSTDVHAKKPPWKVQAKCVLVIVEGHGAHHGWQMSSGA